MDCGMISTLTVSDAVKCSGQFLSPLGDKLSNLTLGEIALFIMTVAVAPPIFSSFGVAFNLLGRIFQRTVKGIRYIPTDQGTKFRHFHIMWFMVTGAIGFVAGINLNSTYVGLSSLWLLVCAALLILSGKSWWGDAIAKH